ncbi:type II secretion system F family protein [uncultured Roseobacter sp.]|uniref:type II secretion system F family protein n=1 Tax=uncultured Roseobacter sp. TaxID=114847 RepID=UPI00262023F3|nr:type II secretion system F family protein [uncultured Roseobacter sp.]
MLDFLSGMIENPERLIPVMAGIAGIAGVVAAALPLLRRDTLARRLSSVAAERSRMAARARAQHTTESEARKLRRNAPRRSLQVVFEAFNLSAKLDDAEIAKNLRRAGFHGHRAVIQFLALRVVMMVVFGVVALFYCTVVLSLPFALPIHLIIALLAAAAGYGGPALYLKNRVTKRQNEIRRNWPDALDLMLICVESGMSIENAFQKVAEEVGSASPTLAEELSLTTAELAYLQDRRTAYEGLARRTDLEAVRGVVTGLIQAEKYGTPLGRTLRVLAQESRDQRMSMAEKKAAALPPKLTVPMILFFLPVLFAVILAPSIMEVM